MEITINNPTGNDIGYNGYYLYSNYPNSLTNTNATADLYCRSLWYLSYSSYVANTDTWNAGDLIYSEPSWDVNTWYTMPNNYARPFVSITCNAQDTNTGSTDTGSTNTGSTDTGSTNTGSTGTGTTIIINNNDDKPLFSQDTLFNLFLIEGIVLFIAIVLKASLLLSNVKK